MISKSTVDKLSKPKQVDKYTKMKEKYDLKDCTFKPVQNKNTERYLKKRSKTVKKLEAIDTVQKEPETEFK